MANNKKGAAKAPKAPAAPTVETPATEEVKTPTTVGVLDMTKFMENVTSATSEGLDPNRRVDLLRMMHETFRTDPNAAQRYKMSQDVVDQINGITAIGQIAALACEVTFAKNPFAIKMNVAQLAAITEVGNAVGVTLDVKALPAPDADGNVTVESSQIKVSQEKQEQIKAEQKIEDNIPELDPTKVEDEEGVRNAIMYLLVHRLNGWEKIHDSINFYRAWLNIQAAKSEEKDAELAKIKAYSDLDILNMIKELVGKCPYVLNGMGHAMFVITASAKSPIQAFCMFRNTTKNKKTGAHAIDDNTVAAYVKSLVTWSAETSIKDAEATIEGYKKDIDLLTEKDAKANEKAIADLKEKIVAATSKIAHYNETIGYVHDAPENIPTEFLANYKAKDLPTNRIYKAVVDSYYDDVNLSEMKPESVYHNIEQRVGIITNLFRNPSAGLPQYAEGNITSLEPVNGTTETEGKN